MARVAVTYEQVAAVANALYAAGDKNPGTKAIREELAKRAGTGGTTGSPNTIQKHLDQWRLKDKPVEAHEAPQLPAQLAADIQRALNAAASNARELVEERLAQVQGELAELAATGEANEARIDELTQELAARTSERDSMAGQLTERTSEVEELKTVLAAATKKTASLERELHEAQTAAQEASGRVEEIRSSTSQQLGAHRPGFGREPSCRRRKRFDQGRCPPRRRAVGQDDARSSCGRVAGDGQAPRARGGTCRLVGCRGRRAGRPDPATDEDQRPPKRLGQDPGEGRDRHLVTWRASAPIPSEGSPQRAPGWLSAPRNSRSGNSRHGTTWSTCGPAWSAVHVEASELRGQVAGARPKARACWSHPKSRNCRRPSPTHTLRVT